MRWMIAVSQTMGTPLPRQPLRQRVMGLIRREPGIHASQICRETGQPWSTVQYHLRLLQQTEMVTSVDTGRERGFFPDDIDAEKANLVMLLREGRKEAIARLIQAQPGIRQVDICRAAPVSRKAFRRSVDSLIEAGLVAEHRGLQTNRYFPGAELRDLLDRPSSMDVA